jgi:hypothetical protein
MDALPFALLLLMLINASSMVEFHMLILVVIMFYIRELIMEIVPNYPTVFEFFSKPSSLELRSKKFLSI